MKKGVKIFFAVIAFIVIATGAFCVWQRENIRAVYMYIAADKGELPSAGILEIPDLPDAGAEDIAQEKENEAGGGAQKNTTKSSTATAAVSGEKSDGTAADNTLTLAESCREELYACEADLVSRVGGMKNEVLAEWRALPKEQRTSRKKREMIISGVSRLTERLRGLLQNTRHRLQRRGRVLLKSRHSGMSIRRRKQAPRHII